MQELHSRMRASGTLEPNILQLSVVMNPYGGRERERERDRERESGGAGGADVLLILRDYESIAQGDVCVCTMYMCGGRMSRGRGGGGWWYERRRTFR